MKAGAAEIVGDYASQARHYMDLGDKCEVELGYLDRALSCYIDAEKIAIEHDLTDILTDSISACVL